MQGDLFQDLKNFRLVRVSDLDAKVKSDRFFDLRRLILDNEEMYPRIARWVDEKVIHGLASGERTGYLGLLDERPVVSAILKKGEVGKFCHLKLDESIRNYGLGELFFVLMALELRGLSEKINFTLPENLWYEKRSFFESFGFGNAEKSDRQYRTFEKELFCTAPFSTVFQSVRSKLPKLIGRFSLGDHSLLSQLLLSLRPNNAEKILAGIKTVEIRRRFSESWQSRRVTLYASRPVGAIVGEAEISKVVKEKPSKIWNDYEHLIGSTREEFDAYVGDQGFVYALVLQNVSAFAERVPIEQLSYLLDRELRPPQSYLRLGDNTSWKSAVTLAAALQSLLASKRRWTMGQKGRSFEP